MTNKENTLRDLQCAQYNVLYHEREIAHHEAALKMEIDRLKGLEGKWKLLVVMQDVSGGAIKVFTQFGQDVKINGIDSLSVELPQS